MKKSNQAVITPYHDACTYPIYNAFMFLLRHTELLDCFENPHSIDVLIENVYYALLRLEDAIKQSCPSSQFTFTCEHLAFAFHLAEIFFNQAREDIRLRALAHNLGTLFSAAVIFAYKLMGPDVALPNKFLYGSMNLFPHPSTQQIYYLETYLLTHTTLPSQLTPSNAKYFPLLFPACYMSWKSKWMLQNSDPALPVPAEATDTERKLPSRRALAPLINRGT